MQNVMVSHDEAQTRACNALLSTVVLLAVSDACIAPTTVRKGDPQPTIPMPMNAFTAMRFLFDESMSGLNEYCMWLDMNPAQFRTRLLTMMEDNSPNSINGYDPMKRRYFRQNYRAWLKLKNKYDVPMEEEDVAE
jgi:hypothetical protein